MANSSRIWLLFLSRFSTIFKNTTKTLYKNNCPCKAGRNVYIEKKPQPTKARFRLYKYVGSLLGGITFVNINGFLFFIRALLKGETLFNQDPHFSRMFFFTYKYPLRITFKFVVSVTLFICKVTLTHAHKVAVWCSSIIHTDTHAHKDT